jgi:hypothetical protein
MLVNNRARSLIDLKVFAQPTWDHHLPFYGERDCIGFLCCTHGKESYYMGTSKSIYIWLEKIINVSMMCNITTYDLGRSSGDPLRAVAHPRAARKLDLEKLLRPNRNQLKL